MILDPTLAVDLDKIKGGLSSIPQRYFPYFAQPKKDGVRILLTMQNAYTRTLKIVRNKHLLECVRKLMSDSSLILDAEIVVGSGRNDATSFVNSYDKVDDFVIYVFDEQSRQLDRYAERYAVAKDYVSRLGDPRITMVPVSFTIEYSDRELYATMNQHTIEHLQSTEEGIIYRSNARYVSGRSTPTNPVLIRDVYKFTETFRIVDFTEQMENENPQEYTLGMAKRSSHQDNRHPKNTLGSLIVTRDDELGTFGVASGLTDELRKEIWQNRDKYRGMLVDVQYKKPVLNAPQHPVFVRLNKGGTVL